MTSSRLFFLGSAALAMACGGKVDETVVGDSALDTGEPLPDSAPLPDVGPVPSGPKPPPRPAAATSGGATKWFAFDSLRLGVTVRATGASSPSAWKEYGYDFDSRITTADDSVTSRNSCRRVSGSPQKVLADGNLGIDNNFGQHVMAVVKSLKSDSEETVNSSIRSGNITMLLRLDNVGPDDNADVPGALFLAAPLGGTPTFTESDKWPIDSASVDASKEAKAKFKGYMAGGMWVSGDFGTGSFALLLPFISGSAASFHLESGVITVRVADGSNGTIAGGATTDSVKIGFTPLMKQFGICPGNATYDQVVATLTQSADLVAGAPQMQNPSVTCNTLSMGLGFSMKPTGMPNTISTLKPPLDPCK